MVYKVKNRHTIDAAVIGFSEGNGETKGQMRALLLALMAEDGDFQIIGRCSIGYTEAQKKELYPKLLKMSVDSKYIETDSNHVAFRMIRPEIVVEVFVNDIIFENSAGNPLVNPILEFKDKVYRRNGTIQGVSLINPVFSRFRGDKEVNKQDLRLAQLNEINVNPYSQTETGVGETLAKSKLLKREVYKKTQGEKLMVQKFLVWKTNKEDSMMYPAYVMAYTNFSSDRADALQNEVRVSDNKTQIMAIYADFIEKNIKKGWEKIV
jgi:hypothetical protein